MLARRQIRMLVVPSRTFYFVDKGSAARALLRRRQGVRGRLNGKLGKRKLRVDVVFVPVSQDDLLPALIQGRGDMAAANLTITPERQVWVDFSAPSGPASTRSS